MPVNLAQYRVIIGTFNASIIMIKIKNRPISRLYYICNTNQLSKQHLIFSSIAIFCFIILFPSKKEIQNLTRLYRSVLFNIMYNSLTVQVKNISEQWYWSQSTSCAKKQNKSFSICHRNLNSIFAHAYAKVSLLKAYTTAHKMDIIC